MSQLLSLCHRAHALQQEKPQQWEARAHQLESGPCSLQLEKAHEQQQRSSTAQINKYIKKNLFMTVYSRGMGFLGGAVVKNLPVNAGDSRDVGLIPGSGRFLGVGSGSPLQYFSLGNLTGREAWRSTTMGSQRVGHDWMHAHMHAHTHTHIHTYY